MLALDEEWGKPSNHAYLHPPPIEQATHTDLVVNAEKGRTPRKRNHGATSTSDYIFSNYGFWPVYGIS